VTLRTLGGLELHDSTFQRPKTLLLLAYLSIEGAKERQHLSTLLWPDAMAKERQHRLRVMLSQLKKEAAGIIDADKRRVSVTIDSDARNFLDHFESGRYEEAVEHYRGHFLQGFQQSDWSVELEEWVYETREFLAARAREALLRLGEEEAARGRFDEAAQRAESAYVLARAAEFEPEDLARCYMLLVAGKHVRAAEVRREAQDFDVLVLLSPGEAQAQLSRAAGVTTPLTHDLPTQTTAFLGRRQELAEIRQLLLDEADCRLVTLFGPGGTGKTRLALAAATNASGGFPDGAYFVSLASVGEAASIVPSIAEALDFRFYGQADPKDQLLDYLSQKQLLLVLDNLEHLLDGTDAISEMLKRAPRIVVLATSRERLALQEEWVYEVQGLSFPAEDDLTTVSTSAEAADVHTAVQLFLHRAGQAEAGFTPSSDEMVDIGRICRLVEGMPLAVELAAPWVRTLSCHEIAAEIERNLDFLSTSLRNVPERHRSLRAVFEPTWGRLTQAERHALMNLSVFRGGWTRDAAEAVAGATLPLLSMLVDKALVRRTKLGRYEVHELIRQFADTHLQSAPEELERNRQRHQAYFLALLATRTSAVKGTEQRATLAEIRADMDNVRLAWRGAVANRDARAIDRAAECLFVFYLYTSGHFEGQGAFELAVAAFMEGPGTRSPEGRPGSPGDEGPLETLLGFLLAAQGYFLSRTREPHAGLALLGRALALLRRAKLRDRRREGFALLWLAWASNYQGRFGEALERVSESLPLFAEAADHWGQAWSLLAWGNCISNSNPAAAEEVLQRGVTACEKSGDQTVLGYVTHNLAAVVATQGRYEEAKRYVAEAITMFRELDNKLGLGYAYSRRGSLATAEGRYKQAVLDLQQALTLFDEVRTPLNVVASQHLLANAFRLQGHHDHAQRLYRQALSVATTSDNQFHIAYCLAGLGCLAHDHRDLSRARRFHREALAIWRHLELDARMADSLQRLGAALVASGERHHEEARQRLRRALELAIQHRLAPVALDVGVSVALLLRMAGHDEDAAAYSSLAHEHQASTFETRMNARQLSRKLAITRPPEKASAGQFRDRSGDLWARMHRLLALMAVLRV
jgi:predicted ATPase/DNA-binding SARP family transcriptional activator